MQRTEESVRCLLCLGKKLKIRLLSKFIFSYPESERKNRKYGTFGRHKEGRYATADRENLLAVCRE